MPTFELKRLLSYDDESVLAELCRVAALVNSPFLTKKAFDQHSKVHSSTVRERFGSWQQALERAGLDGRSTQSPAALRIINRRFSDDELLSELRLVSERTGGGPLTQELFNQHAKMNAVTVSQRFGTWEKALKRARLSVSPRQKRYSENEYFENLLTVWTHHARQPNYGEMNEAPSLIPISAYEHKWGNWTKALLAFLERVNADTRPEEIQPITVAQEPKDRPAPRRRSRRKKDEVQRQIKLGLRYAVLKRDRFRCVLCGTSPATDLGCVLHVDHVIAWSKGGMTVVENLRTLCEPCNLGKGDQCGVDGS